MTRIFLSYRRQDTAFLADSLSEKLEAHFGKNSVFYDVYTIPPGVDFHKHIAAEVGNCDVLIVLIGNQWLNAADDEGKRRLDDESDVVRIEIESALMRTIPVIPVRVGEARIPNARDLPESIKALSARNATEIRSGRDLRQDIQRLIESIEELQKLPSAEKPERDPPKRRSVRQTSKKKPPVAAPKKKSVAVPEGHTLMDRIRKDPTILHASFKRATMLVEIKRIMGDFTDSCIFVGDAIPPKKLANAIGTYAPGVAAPDALLLYDNTTFGGAKEGVLIAVDAIFWHNPGEPPACLAYSEIESVKARDDGLIGKLFVNTFIEIHFHFGEKHAIAGKLALVIQALIDLSSV